MRRVLLVMTVTAVSLIAAPVARGADSAHVAGYAAVDGVKTPNDLVFGAHSRFRVAGHIDDVVDGQSALRLGVRPVPDDNGKATCPATELPIASVFDFDADLSASDFAVDLPSGAWNIAHNVLVCFYFHHRDNSVTRGSENLVFRAPIDTIAISVPASTPGAASGAAASLLLSVTGETDGGYAGQVRIQPAAIPCGASSGDTSKLPDTITTIRADVTSPGDARFYEGVYAALSPAGIDVNIAPIIATPGTYRVCAWIGPTAEAPVFSTSTTFEITPGAGSPVSRRAAGRVTFGSTRSRRPRKRVFRAGSATCVRGCTVTFTAKAGGSTVARGSARLRDAGKVTVRLTLSKAAARKLRRRHKLAVTVRVVVKAVDTKTVTRTKKLTLKG